MAGVQLELESIQQAHKATMDDRESHFSENEFTLTEQILSLETENSSLNRELGDLKLELSEAQKSQEQLTEAEREINEKRIRDQMVTIQKLREQIKNLENASIEYRDELDNEI